MQFGKWFFSFNRNERRGIIILSCLIIISYIAIWLVDYMTPTPQWQVHAYEAKPLEKRLKDTTVSKNVNEINTMSLEDWLHLGGLSKASCMAIVNYRKALGGFYTLRQIKEVVAISDTMLARWDKFVYCDLENIHKLRLDVQYQNDLEMHPYIGKDLAQFLLGLSTKQTTSQCLEQLYMVASEDKVDKIKRYLIFD